MYLGYFHCLGVKFVQLAHRCLSEFPDEDKSSSTRILASHYYLVEMLSTIYFGQSRVSKWKKGVLCHQFWEILTKYYGKAKAHILKLVADCSYRGSIWTEVLRRKFPKWSGYWLLFFRNMILNALGHVIWNLLPLSNQTNSAHCLVEKWHQISNHLVQNILNLITENKVSSTFILIA